MMLAYTARRALATIPVMGLVALFVFSLLYLAPGDPAAVMAGDQATAADVERILAGIASVYEVRRRAGALGRAYVEARLGAAARGAELLDGLLG